MSHTLETVLFDLDGTLCEYERPSSEALSAAFDRIGREPLFEMEDFYARYTEFLRESESGVELFERTFTALARDLGEEPELGGELARAFCAEREPWAVRPVEGASSVVEALASEYRIGLVTNGHPDIQRRKLDRIGLADAFETQVFAGYETAAKPDPEPFRRALADLDATPTGAVYVGDIPQVDVPGAQAAGLRAAWMRSDRPLGDAEPDYVLDSLAALRTPPW